MAGGASAPASMVRRFRGAGCALGSEHRADWRMENAASELAKVRAVIAERLAEYEDNHALLSARLDALRASVDVTDDESRPRSDAPATRPGQGIGQR